MRFLLIAGLILLTSCSNPNSTPKASASPSPAPTNNQAPVQNNNTNPQQVSNQPAPIAAPQPPLITISGFKKGDTYNVDGPLWYDGTAKLEEFNNNEMRINMSISVPSVGLPYQIKDGKINVTIKLFRDSKLNCYIYDLNKNKTYMLPNVSLETGKTSSGWFSSEKEYAKIIATNQYYNFTVESPTVISITSNTMPGGLTLFKK